MMLVEVINPVYIPVKQEACQELGPVHGHKARTYILLSIIDIVLKLEVLVAEAAVDVGDVV
jgi:hypothetical protein